MDELLEVMREIRDLLYGIDAKLDLVKNEISSLKDDSSEEYKYTISDVCGKLEMIYDELDSIKGDNPEASLSDIGDKMELALVRERLALAKPTEQEKSEKQVLPEFLS